MTPSPSGLADAAVIADQVGAGRRVNARIGRAVVDVHLAMASGESSGALTRVIGHTVDASGPVETGRVLTFVHVQRAIVTAETGQTGALEAVNEIGAGAVILARIRLAFVNVEASARWRSAESRKAETLVRVDSVDALRIGRTGDIETVVNVDLTARTGETGRTGALDVVESRTANATVETRVCFAGDHRRFQQHLHHSYRNKITLDWE